MYKNKAKETTGQKKKTKNTPIRDGVVIFAVLFISIVGSGAVLVSFIELN
jgi:hypothetical protein